MKSRLTGHGIDIFKLQPFHPPHTQRGLLLTLISIKPSVLQFKKWHDVTL